MQIQKEDGLYSGISTGVYIQSFVALRNAVILRILVAEGRVTKKGDADRAYNRFFSDLEYCIAKARVLQKAGSTVLR